MSEQSFRYVIVGANLSGGYAVDGIRERDPDGSILLIGSEPFLPYERPPLTKKLWSGKKKVEELFFHDELYYEQKGVHVLTGTTITGLDSQNRTVIDQDGNKYRYEKLLLATGGAPRRLSIPGGNLDGIYYYRTLSDYLRLRPAATKGRSAVVVGGGFIGSEISAALQMQQVKVTMVSPDPYLVHRVFPESLGRAMAQLYQEKGVDFVHGRPASFSRSRTGTFVTTTEKGEQVESDLLIVGVGIVPSTQLAGQAGLQVDNGIVVNEYMQTSNPAIYAAGDNAFFPYQALGKSTRVEHWDNAVNQGRWAGHNMAGPDEPYTYMPYFYSDLFEFGYEAVGEVDSKLQTYADWQKENDTGVIYYLQDGRIRGVMTCNIYGKMDVARELIRRGEQLAPEKLRRKQEVTPGGLQGLIR